MKMSAMLVPSEGCEKKYLFHSSNLASGALFEIFGRSTHSDLCLHVHMVFKSVSEFPLLDRHQWYWLGPTLLHMTSFSINSMCNILSPNKDTCWGTEGLECNIWIRWWAGDTVQPITSSLFHFPVPRLMFPETAAQYTACTKSLSQGLLPGQPEPGEANKQGLTRLKGTHHPRSSNHPLPTGWKLPVTFTLAERTKGLDWIY